MDGHYHQSRLRRLESGVRQVINKMDKTGKAFSDGKIKNAKEALQAKYEHHSETMSAEKRLGMLLDQLRQTQPALEDVIQTRHASKGLKAALRRIQDLLLEFGEYEPMI